MKKNNPFLLIFFIALVSCNSKETAIKKTPIKATKQRINFVVDNWHKAAGEANFENYFNTLDNGAVFIGTDAAENWNKTEFSAYSKPHFDKGKAWSFTAIERNIYTNDAQNLAWFDELLETHMGICRGSGVLEKKEKEWKIKHYVLSLTIPNDNVSKVLNLNKEKDSLFLKKMRNKTKL